MVNGTADRLLGSLRRAGDEGVVRMKTRVEAAPGDVWAALTRPVRLAAWLGQVDGDLRLDGEFRARFHASGWVGTGRVTVCEPGSRLRVVTRGLDDPREGSIVVTLAPDGEGTRVVWEERPIPVELLAAYGAGIQIHVEDLTAHLAGGERCDADARFPELFSAYQHQAVD